MSDIEGSVNIGLGGFIRQAIGEGLSMTATRRTFREAGVGRMSNQAFSQLFGQIREAVGNRDRLARLDYNLIPDADVYSQWAAGTPDRYASFVQVFVREPGTRMVTSRFHQHISSDPHSPQEALDAAMATVSAAAADNGTDFDAVVLDGVVTSMTRTVARAA